MCIVVAKTIKLLGKYKDTWVWRLHIWFSSLCDTERKDGLGRAPSHPPPPPPQRMEDIICCSNFPSCLVDVR
jgi:hypothetical protein